MALSVPSLYTLCMNRIDQRIDLLREEIDQLRTDWKEASVSMQKHIEQKAREKKHELEILEAVVKRREQKNVVETV